MNLVIPVTAANQTIQTTNLYGHELKTYGSVINSYLNRKSDGNYERVEWIEDKGQVLVETRSASFDLISQKLLDKELEKFGYVCFGKQYNYVIYGRNNMSFNLNYEICRVVKYDKSWNKIKSCSIKTSSSGEFPIEVSTIFSAGSCKAVEYGDYLYILTCKEAFPSADGLRHQSSLYLVVKVTDMSFDPTRSGMTQYSEYGLSSHSFNEFIEIDNNKIVVAQHGDAYPRSVVLSKFQTDATKGKYNTYKWHGSNVYSNRVGPINNNLYNIPGTIGDNTTGVTLGDFVVTDTAYLTAGTLKKDDNSSQVVIWSIPKNFTSSTKATTKIFATVQYNSIKRNPTPYLIKLNKKYNGYEYCLLWNEGEKKMSSDNSDCVLKYVFVDSNGKTSDTVHTVEGLPLSSCKPIQVNDMLVWYTTYKSDAQMRILSLVDIIEPFVDVREGTWYSSAVRFVYENKYFCGTSSFTFSPNDDMTRAMVVTVLWRLTGSPTDGLDEVELPFDDIKTNSYYYTPVKWAYANGITAGTSAHEFSPNGVVTREQAVTFFWRMADSPEVGLDILDKYDDKDKISGWADNAMAWAISNGVVSGTSATTLSPTDESTRSQFAVILMKYCNLQ